jgi:hypothetical protein
MTVTIGRRELLAASAEPLSRGRSRRARSSLAGRSSGSWAVRRVGQTTQIRFIRDRPPLLLATGVWQPLVAFSPVILTGR